MSEKSERMSRLYNSRRWRNRSEQHRRLHPFCAQCEREAEAKGQITVSLAVLCHHIGTFDEKRQSDVEFWLMPIEGLCHRHHELIHGRNPPRDYDPSIGLDGWPISADHPANRNQRKAK